MTDADALSDLVRVGLRNPARIVVKVQARKSKKDAKGEIIEERRIPAGYDFTPGSLLALLTYGSASKISTSTVSSPRSSYSWCES